MTHVDQGITWVAAWSILQLHVACVQIMGHGHQLHILRHARGMSVLPDSL
jgi:hypothetical protein